MADARTNIPAPHNEPVRAYAPGSPDRTAVKVRLAELTRTRTAVPMVIGGKDVQTRARRELHSPHRRQLVIAECATGTRAHVGAAIDAALKARAGWAATPFNERAAIFLRAAAMLAGPWRDTINAATMLGQSKTVHQAEIDAACELIDFWRFNLHYAETIYEQQPQDDPHSWNNLEYRALEGFVFAVSPFNFTSIAGNLPTAPAIMGNVVVYKPAAQTLLACHFLMQLLREAGLPDGVINMVTGDAGEVGAQILAHRELAGVHFTGSTGVFQWMWKTIGANIERYRGYPRVVGETGGKDFVFAHASAGIDELRTALVRGAFEYQGQKCSAASRAYIPQSLWKTLRDDLSGEVDALRQGDVADFRNFMGAVIDESAFRKHSAAIAYARKNATVIAGGTTDDSTGWFVRPTVVVTDDPDFKLLKEELFGPILTVHPYPDARYEETLDICDRTSPYALTGAIFARDRAAIRLASERLINAAGNFYINDKPTGAVVGLQPFGGARASGTNDKAGSYLNLVRWVSPRAIKETYVPPTDHRYPFMTEE